MFIFHTKYNGYDLNGFQFPTSKADTSCNFLKQICFLPKKKKKNSFVTF